MFNKNIKPSNAIGKSIVLLMSGTVLAQMVTIAGMPIITRLFSPEEVGVLTVFLSFFTFWSQLLTLRFESALFIEKKIIIKKLLLGLCVLLTLVMSLIAIPILLGLIKGNLLGFELLPVWFPYIAILLFVSFGLFSTFRAVSLRNGLVKSVTVATVIKAITNVLIKIIAGLLGFGVFGLIVAEAFSMIFCTAWLFSKFKMEKSIIKVKWVSFSKLLFVAKKYKKFPKYELPSTALDQLAIAIPVPIIAHLYGASAAGWYGFARLLVAIPNSQVGRAVSDAFQMSFSEHIRSNNFIMARKLYYKLLYRLLLVGLAPLLAVMLLAPTIVPYIFGDDWSEMGQIAMIIAPWLYLALVVGSLSRVLSVLEAQEFKLIYDLTVLTLILGLYLLSQSLSLTLYKFLAYLTIVNIFSYIVYLIIQIKILTQKTLINQTSKQV